MVYLIVLAVALLMTGGIWGGKHLLSTGSEAEDAMASVPAMFGTVAIWVVATLLMLSVFIFRLLHR